MSERPPADNPPSTRCPTCNAVVPTDRDSFPFCSQRCKLVDLGRWLKEDYRISRGIEQRDLEESD